MAQCRWGNGKGQVKPESSLSAIEPAANHGLELVDESLSSHALAALLPLSLRANLRAFADGAAGVGCSRDRVLLRMTGGRRMKVFQV